MRWPVNNDFRITQYFHSGHKAVDIAPEVRGAKGIHIVSPVKGRVLTVQYKRWKWNWPKDQFVIITAEDGYTHYLGHMVKGSPVVRAGQLVNEGDLIGIMGTTGYSSGIHTHYRIRTPQGLNVDPIGLFANHGITITNTKAIYPVTSYAQYQVRRGDTLNKIAAKFNISLKSLLAINPQIGNPNFIFPGQMINIKGTTIKKHVVKRGDNMYNIARAYNIPYSKLIAMNPQIKNPSLIYVGQEINIQ